jgi:hypothetical protein
VPVLERLPLGSACKTARSRSTRSSTAAGAAPDFVGQLGAVHALDALAFGLLALALLLLGAVALGGFMSPDRSRMPVGLAFLGVPTRPAPRAGQPL